jgi:hypothetical protein
MNEGRIIFIAFVIIIVKTLLIWGFGALILWMADIKADFTLARAFATNLTLMFLIAYFTSKVTIKE